MACTSIPRHIASIARDMVRDDKLLADGEMHQATILKRGVIGDDKIADEISDEILNTFDTETMRLMLRAFMQGHHDKLVTMFGDMADKAIKEAAEKRALSALDDEIESEERDIAERLAARYS